LSDAARGLLRRAVAGRHHIDVHALVNLFRGMRIELMVEAQAVVSPHAGDVGGAGPFEVRCAINRAASRTALP
jgi:hypothetical protein